MDSLRHLCVLYRRDARSRRPRRAGTAGKSHPPAVPGFGLCRDLRQLHDRVDSNHGYVVCRQDLNYPPTSVGGIFTCRLLCLGRQYLKESTHCRGWDLKSFGRLTFFPGSAVQTVLNLVHITTFPNCYVRPSGASPNAIDREITSGIEEL